MRLGVWGFSGFVVFSCVVLFHVVWGFIIPDA